MRASLHAQGGEFAEAGYKKVATSEVKAVAPPAPKAGVAAVAPAAAAQPPKPPQQPPPQPPPPEPSFSPLPPSTAPQSSAAQPQGAAKPSRALHVAATPSTAPAANGQPDMAQEVSVSQCVFVKESSSRSVRYAYPILASRYIGIYSSMIFDESNWNNMSTFCIYLCLAWCFHPFLLLPTRNPFCLERACCVFQCTLMR